LGLHSYDHTRLEVAIGTWGGVRLPSVAVKIISTIICQRLAVTFVEAFFMGARAAALSKIRHHVKLPECRV